MRIGVISDTHGLLRPSAVAALSDVDAILHAGDVGNPAILARLAAIAPLTAIRGNVDTHEPLSSLPATEMVDIAGCMLYLVHSVHDLDIAPSSAGVRVVVSGHSHQPSIEERGGVLYLNPGSAGPRRFRLPVTLAYLTIDKADVRAEIVALE